MTFEYLQRVIVDGEVEVPDIGNCTLQGRNDIGEEFYLIIKSELGWVECAEYGPITPDLMQLPLTYTINYSRFEYNQGKIERIIDKFLNNPKRMISQAQIVELQDIIKYLVNPIDKIIPIQGGILNEQ